ncbi:hypothetical protein [Aquimarina algiphila]|uniref:hypothetical protein n=1 Tax=Aquimarina algiphila TaxID=2047982 RepID=UPI00232C40E7|nr:hypothetical protein [Aquimarina algiphila]
MKTIKKATRVIIAIILIILSSCSKDDDAPQNKEPQVANQEFTIAEDVKEKEVLATIVVVNTENDPLTFSITTNDNDLFTITQKGELTLAIGKTLNYNIAQSHTIIIEVSDGTNTTAASITITVTNVDDVYALGTEENSAGIRIPMLWKNGEATVLPSNTANQTFAKAVAVANNGDVYVAGYEQNVLNSSAILWKNGEVIQLADPNKISIANDIYIINDDIYVSGNEVVVFSNPNGTTSSVSTATVWENGEATHYTNVENRATQGKSIYVLGNDVYVAGTIKGLVGNFPVFWKNGELNILSNGNVAEATAIYVTEDDVYVTGYEISTPSVPILWKNDEDTVLPLGTNSGAEPQDIYVSNNDVYVVGYHGDTSNFWKNNTLVNGLNDAAFIFFNTVHVSGNNTYLGGAEFNTTKQKNIATIWKNEEKIPLTDGSNNAIVNDVVVK